MSLDTFSTYTLNKFLEALESENSKIQEEINGLVIKQNSLKNEMSVISKVIQDREKAQRGEKITNLLKFFDDEETRVVNFKSLTWEEKVRHVLSQKREDYITSSQILDEFVKEDPNINILNSESRRKIMKRISSSLSSLVKGNLVDRIIDNEGQYKYKLN